MAIKFEFTFTAVRKMPAEDGIQLGALGLLDMSGNLLTIADISNPGGRNPYNQFAGNLILYQSQGFTTADELIAGFEATSTTKWYDDHFAPDITSTLEIILDAPAIVGAYTFMTAFDVPRRDPVSWTLSAVMSDDFRSVGSSGDSGAGAVERVESGALHRI